MEERRGSMRDGVVVSAHLKDRWKERGAYVGCVILMSDDSQSYEPAQEPDDINRGGGCWDDGWDALSVGQQYVIPLCISPPLLCQHQNSPLSPLLR